MASIYNINNGIKNLLDQYENCDTAQILILGEYHRMRESFYTRVILNHTGTRAILPRYQGPCKVYR